MGRKACTFHISICWRVTSENIRQQTETKSKQAKLQTGAKLSRSREDLRIHSLAARPMEHVTDDAAANCSWLLEPSGVGTNGTRLQQLGHMADSLKLVLTMAIMVGAAVSVWLVAKLFNLYVSRAPLPSSDSDSEMSEHTVRLLRLQRQRGQRQLSEEEKANWRSVVVDMWHRRPSSIDLDELRVGSSTGQRLDGALHRLKDAWRQLRPLDEVEDEDQIKDKDVEAAELGQSVEQRRLRHLDLMVQRLGAVWLAESRRTAQLQEESTKEAEATVTSEQVQEANETRDAAKLEEAPAEAASSANYVEAATDEAVELTDDAAEAAEAVDPSTRLCAVM